MERMPTGSAAPSCCPQCGRKARNVSAETVHHITGRALLECEGFVFCGAPDCDVVYAAPATGRVLRQDDVPVVVFQKSRSGSRLACYCFRHSVADIEADFVQHGRSTIAERITEACRNGLDRCEQTNPQGTCCLGNVRAVAKGAAASPPARACCRDEDQA